VVGIFYVILKRIFAMALLSWAVKQWIPWCIAAQIVPDVSFDLVLVVVVQISVVAYSLKRLVEANS
jgi:hypothetical protein